MNVERIDFGRLQVGRLNLSELRCENGVWHRPRPSKAVTDLFAGPLDELRAELRKGVDEFRAECAPRVGPQVTRRGVVVSEPVIVPVDPTAYLRHHFDLAAKACQHALRRVGAAFESFGRSLRNAYGGEQ